MRRRLRLEVVQRERRRRPPCGRRGRWVSDQRGPYQTLALVWTDLASQFVVGELDMLLAEHSKELVDVEIEKTELRVGVTRQMQNDQSVSVTDDTLDTEVIDGTHLGRDVVVLEMFGHLGEPAASSEAEERASRRRERRRRGGTASGTATMMNVNDDALTVHTEREATVLVKDPVTRQRALRKPRRI